MENQNLQELREKEFLERTGVFSEKLNSVEVQIKQFEEFYKNTFQDEGERKSTANQITGLLSNLKKDLGDVVKVKGEVEKFSQEVFHGNGTESIKNKVENIVKELEETLKNYNAKTQEINAAYNVLITGESGKESTKSEILKIKDEFTRNLTENSNQLIDLKAFYKSVFEKSTNEVGGESDGLKITVETLKIKLENLIKNANEKLAALTDSALHNSFAVRAKSHTDEYGQLQNYTFRSVIAIAGVTVVFAICAVD